jgi:hypothetical protein
LFDVHYRKHDGNIRTQRLRARSCDDHSFKTDVRFVSHVVQLILLYLLSFFFVNPEIGTLLSVQG